MKAKFELPATFEMHVWIIDDGGVIGKATVDLSFGVYPRQKEIEAAIETVKKSLPYGFRICTQNEFADLYILEKTGTKMMSPGMGEFAEPYSVLE